MLAPDAKERHAVIDFRGLPQALSGFGAAPRLQSLEQAHLVARCVPELPGRDAGGVPGSVAVRPSVPQVDVPAEAIDRLPAHAAMAGTARERGLTIGRGRRPEGRGKSLIRS